MAAQPSPPQVDSLPQQHHDERTASRPFDEHTDPEGELLVDFLEVDSHHSSLASLSTHHTTTTYPFPSQYQYTPIQNQQPSQETIAPSPTLYQQPNVPHNNSHSSGTSIYIPSDPPQHQTHEYHHSDNNPPNTPSQYNPSIPADSSTHQPTPFTGTEPNQHMQSQISTLENRLTTLETTITNQFSIMMGYLNPNNAPGTTLPDPNDSIATNATPNARSPQPSDPTPRRNNINSSAAASQREKNPVYSTNKQAMPTVQSSVNPSPHTHQQSNPSNSTNVSTAQYWDSSLGRAPSGYTVMNPYVAPTQCQSVQPPTQSAPVSSNQPTVPVTNPSAPTTIPLSTSLPPDPPSNHVFNQNHVPNPTPSAYSSVKPPTKSAQQTTSIPNQHTTPQSSIPKSTSSHNPSRRFTAQPTNHQSTAMPTSNPLVSFHPSTRTAQYHQQHHNVNPTQHNIPPPHQHYQQPTSTTHHPHQYHQHQYPQYS